MLGRWIHDRPIVFKIALAPAAILLVLTVASAGTLFLMGRQQAALETIREAGTRQLHASELSADLARAHAMLYRMAAQGTNATNVIDGSAFDMNAMMTELAARLGDLRVRTDALLAELPDGAANAGLAGLAMALHAYEKQANQVADLAALGSAQAMRRILEADARFAELAPALAELATAIDRKAEAAWAGSLNRHRLARLNFLVAAGIAIMAGSLLAWRVSGTISRRVTALATVIDRLSEGDLDLEIPDDSCRDEIGRIEKAAQVFRAKLGENAEMSRRERASQERAAHRQAERERLFRDFGAAVGALAGRIVEAVGALHATANGVLRNARETTSRSSSVARSATETSAGIRAASDAAARLAESVREISQRMVEAADAAAAAVRQADLAESRILSLADTAREVGEVVGIIAEIAGRTNLLALNATIEAARAGEAGRGFAVVAGEVKMLASRTGQATDEISGRIGAILGSVTEALSAIRTANDAVRRIDVLSTSVAAAIEDQDAATSSIAANVEAMSASAGEISKTIDGIADIAGNTGRHAAAVVDAADIMGREAETLRAEVEGFLSAVRAA